LYKEKNVKRIPRPALIRPATQAFAREARRTPGYSLFDWLHGYVYARWPYLYIGIGTGEHPLSRIAAAVVGALSRVFPALRGPAEPGQVTFADTYHGKVVPLDAAKRLVTVKRDIRIENLERVIPYARARDIVLQHPDHIVVLECPCRTVRPDPCLPLDVCLIVGEPMASFIAEHHPGRSRWIDSQEAVAILQAEHERGHVHHAFFKDAMLGRFYAICNCCSCCCGAMQAHRNGIPMLASSGYVSTVDVERCEGCGECAAFCSFGALAVHDGRMVVNAAQCMGCSACVSKCAHGALSLARDPAKGEPLEIEVLLEQAAL
jgi:ferredoxin